MSTLLDSAATLCQLAEKAKIPTDAYIRALAVYREYEATQHSSRAASDEDKERIGVFLKNLNGNGTLHKWTPQEILIEAGVRRNQGTASYARHCLHQLRLSNKS